MDIKDLRPNPENPRKITDEKLQALKKSLEEFGDLSGIVYNQRTGRLVGGHQRMRVVPVDAKIEGDFIYAGGQKYSFRTVDWDETKEKAANIAANAHGGTWDYPKLLNWIHELDSENFDLDLTGFDKEEIEEMMTHSPEEEPQQEAKAITCPNCNHTFNP